MNPVILDFSEIDRAARKDAGRLLLAIAIVSALFVAAIVGPLMLRESSRIANAICAGEEMV